jgi:uncharacterized protein (DUF952 family)
MRLFHIVTPAAWAEAVAAGDYRPASLVTEGFVHLSFAEQVEGVANALYRDQEQLQVVEMEISDDRVVVEDSYASGTAFPHLYGPIDPAWALAIHPLRRLHGGDWSFSGRSDREASDR